MQCKLLRAEKSALWQGLGVVPSTIVAEQSFLNTCVSIVDCIVVCNVFLMMVNSFDLRTLINRANEHRDVKQGCDCDMLFAQQSI